MSDADHPDPINAGKTFPQCICNHPADRYINEMTDPHTAIREKLEREGYKVEVSRSALWRVQATKAGRPPLVAQAADLNHAFTDLEKDIRGARVLK